jgi:hypothetical protein
VVKILISGKTLRVTQPSDENCQGTVLYSRERMPSNGYEGVPWIEAILSPTAFSMNGGRRVVGMQSFLPQAFSMNRGGGRRAVGMQSSLLQAIEGRRAKNNPLPRPSCPKGHK